MLRLEFPNISHKSAYMELMNEWNNHSEKKAGHVSPWALFRGENFEEFLQIAENDLTKNHRWVPASLFFLMDEENRILWAIQIRHSIDLPHLRDWGGHIGYGIRSSERQKWYATEMLRLGLIEGKKIGLEKVMLGCLDNNIGSYRTIEKNGGIFEKHTIFDWEKSRIYWIQL